MSHKSRYLQVILLIAIILLTACAQLPATPEATQTTAPAVAVQKASYGPVEVNGRRTSLTCAGIGSPTIIWDYAFAQDTSDWSTWVENLAQTTRVCAVSRDYWASSSTAAKPTAQDLVDDLHAVLAKAALPAPYVLVGYQSGGLVTRLYAGQYPSDVSGMVLLMSWHPDQETRLAQAISSTPGVAATPAPEEDLLTFFYQTDKYSLQGLDLQSSFDQVRAVKDLGDIPLRVLTADFSSLMGNASITEAWNSMQQELAALSSAGKLVTVPHVGMMLTLSGKIPQEVNDAVIQVLDSARAP